MGEPRICESCQAWQCKEEDAWCGYCGAPCGRLELTVKPSILVIGEIAPRLGIRLTNPTLSPLSIDSATVPEWVTLEPCVGRSLGPGQQCLLWASASTHSVSQPLSGEIAIATNIGKVAQTVSAIEDQPAILATPNELEIWEAPGQANRKVSVQLAPQAGELTIHSVQRGPSSGLNVTTVLNAPFRASAQSPLPLILDAKNDILIKKSYASLLVRFEGAHGARETEVKILSTARKPPRLMWVDQNKPPETRYQSAGQRVRMVFRNQSDDDADGGRRNAKLIIQSVTLSPPQECVGCVIQRVSRLPLEIAGGEEGAVEFDLDCERMEPAATDLFHFDVEVKANVAAPRLHLPLFIRPLPEFDGVLAIDFGSSNTTCAVVETGCDLQPISLETGEAVSPTYIQYLDLASDEPEINIGSDVKTMAAIDDDVAASTLNGLKQKLGQSSAEVPVRPRNSELWVKRKVAQAAADYLHQVRRAAERNKNAVFHKFVITHPAVCSQEQFRNLKDALKQAFGDGSIRLLQEPIAAVVPLIAGIVARPDCPTHDFTVASFDLGGGTTDIAVLVVHRERRKSGLEEVQLRIVNSRGVRFGGEDLTTFLQERLLENCDRLLAAREAGVRVIRERMAGGSPGAVRRNEFALRNAAERFKASLSREGKTDPPDQINLRVYVEEKQSVQNRTLLFQEVCTAGGYDLWAEFAGYTRDRVRNLAELLRKCATDVLVLDYIHLSGKTSFLPIVEETIRGAFPNVKQIVAARNPKECVVAGACLSVSMRSSTERRLVLPPGERTTSSIGVFDVITRRFRVILPVDKEIPEDGLTGELPRYWFGEENISLWENLGLSDENIEAALHEGLLTKLGAWTPERTALQADGAPWTLRLVLKDFDVQVSAIGPSGEQIHFQRVGKSR